MRYAVQNPERYWPDLIQIGAGAGSIDISLSLHIICDLMLRYCKGARCERELLNKLYGMSYSVIRSAGSGVNSISPDIVAIKNGKGLAFECKAWERSSLSIEAEKYDALLEWERNSGMN